MASKHKLDLLDDAIVNRFIDQVGHVLLGAAILFASGRRGTLAIGLEFLQFIL